MKTLIISYTLFKPGQNYQVILDKIKSGGFWAKLSESTYLINTTRTVVEVRDDLKSVMDANDTVFVCVAPPPSAWHNLDPEVSKWIIDNQT